MADEADVAGNNTDVTLEAAIRRVGREIPPGEPGDCDFCGEWSGRLIRGACAPCRDRYKLDKN